jgi:hypothetical protein
MSQSFTRILDNQSNKLLSNMVAVADELNIQNIVSTPAVGGGSVVAGGGVTESKNIHIFGYEFTIYTLLLIIILIGCVVYFLYKYFFTKTDLVVYKKINNEKNKLKNKLKNKEEYSEILESSHNSGSHDSLSHDSAHTLDV